MTSKHLSVLNEIRLSNHLNEVCVSIAVSLKTTLNPWINLRDRRSGIEVKIHIG